MHEQWTPEQELVTVQVLPDVRLRPCRVARFRKRMRFRSKSEHVKQQRFVIALPPMALKPTFWCPSMSHGVAAVSRPLPVRPLVEHLRKRANVALCRIRPDEIGGACQCAREQNG